MIQRTRVSSALSRRGFLRSCASSAAVLAGGSLLAACGGGSSSGSSSGRLTVRFAGPSPVAAFWPVYVADAEGMFEKAGVDFSFTTSSKTGVQQLVSGDINIFATNTDQPALAVNKGAQIAAIFAAINSPFNFVVGKGITSYEDLRGKKIGTSVLGSADAALVAEILAHNGLPKGSYDLVAAGSGPNKVAAMASAQISGCTLSQPQDAQLLASVPGSRSLGYSSDYFNAQTILAFAGKSWASDNRDGVQRLIRTQTEATAWLVNTANRNRAVEILQTMTKATPDIARATYDLYQERGLFANSLEINLPAAGRFLKLAEQAGEGPFKDIREYVDLSYLKGAE
jgi:NitT/TauT family transport system substrate-binding protein